MSSSGQQDAPTEFLVLPARCLDNFTAKLKDPPNIELAQIANKFHNKTPAWRSELTGLIEYTVRSGEKGDALGNS